MNGRGEGDTGQVHFLIQGGMLAQLQARGRDLARVGRIAGGSSRHGGGEGVAVVIEEVREVCLVVVLKGLVQPPSLAGLFS